MAEMKILTFDLGKTTGWAYLDKTGISFGHWIIPTYAPFGKAVKDLIDLYKPEIIVCSQTNGGFGHWGATRKMFMLFGIVCYVAEKKEIPVVELNDTQARKLVFGSNKGKGRMKKVDAHIKFDEIYPEYAGCTGDTKDAIILAIGWQKLNTEKNEHTSDRDIV